MNEPDPTTGPDPTKDDEQTVIDVSSAVSAFDGHPFVEVRWGLMSGQLTPEEAFEHGAHMIYAAAVAEQDALVVAELEVGVGLERQAALGFLMALRKRRTSVSPWG